MPTEVALETTALGESSHSRTYWGDLLAGFGCANVAYIGHWSHLLTLGSGDLFWFARPPSPIQYAALILSTAILGLLVFALLRAARRGGSLGKLARVLLFVCGVLSLNSVRDLISGYYPDAGGNILRSISVPTLWCAIAVSGILLLLAAKYLKGLLGPLRAALIAVAMFGIWNAAKAGYQMVHPDTRLAAPHAAVPFLPSNPTTPKVVWMVFDELDYRLAFLDRRPDVSLPVLEELRQTAIFGTNAFPPSSSTNSSMLAYLLGDKVTDLHPLSVDNLFVKTAAHPEGRSWKQLPNLFSAARQVGVNGAVVGWYLPYSRLLGSDVVGSWWFDKVSRDAAVGDTLPAMLLNQPRTLIETSLLSPFGQSLLTQRRIGMFHEFMSKTQEFLMDDRIKLLLLHVPVPHTPYFYDRRTGQDSLANSTLSGYWDALALVDKVVGQIRTQMKEAGTWDSSAVLVTADHYYRTAMRLDGRMDRRVPFLLKMPGQRRPYVVGKAFNTQLSHDLVLEILQSKVQTDDDAVQWLDDSSSTVPPGWGTH